MGQLGMTVAAIIIGLYLACAAADAIALVWEIAPL
jgi:hypothetical protein